LPWTRVIEAFSKRVCPGQESEKLSQTKASPEGGGSFLPPSRVRLKTSRGLTKSSSPAFGTYTFSDSLCLSCIRFSLFVSFSPASTFARTASSCSDLVGSSFFLSFEEDAAVSFARRLAAASSFSRSSRVSSSSSTSPQGFAWKSGSRKQRTTSWPAGGLGTWATRLSASL